MKRLILVISTACLFLLAGCEYGPKSGRGFTLPDGDPVKGKATFIVLQCNACHTVYETPEIKQPENFEISVEIGGKVKRIQSYGELVTSIINPSHRLAKGYPREMIESNGQSKMTNYNAVMKVDQLIDLVAFLQSRYELDPYTPTTYPTYY